VTAAIQGERQGFHIPRISAAFVVTVAACIFAALVLQAPKAGSVLALAVAAPMVFLLWQARQDVWTVRAKRACAALMIGCLASLAYAPGILNIALAWLLLVVGAFVLRSAGAVEPMQVPLATIRQFFDGIARSFADGLSVVAVSLYLPAMALAHVAKMFLPIAAGIVFAVLLVTANPLLQQAVVQLDFAAFIAALNNILSAATSPFALWFIVLFGLSWPALRGFAVVSPRENNARPSLLHDAFFHPAAVIATLLLLNGMFALQNLMDVAFVWSGAKLPDGMSHAQYVHRGSYTLIVTVLLAAALMVFMLRKGSAAEQSRMVQGLVHLWTFQNLVLVASSAKRTLSYIADYGWTEWRVSGLIWMGLVCFGLITIALRVVRMRDARWLINVNMMATMVVLLLVSAWNMQGFIAERNVQRVLAGPTKMLDLDYLESLGPAVLPALVQLNEQSGLRSEGYRGGYYALPVFHVNRLLAERDWLQDDWRSWTIAHALLGHALAGLPSQPESGIPHR
jgi:hypothetical protein